MQCSKCRWCSNFCRKYHRDWQRWRGTWQMWREEMKDQKACTCCGSAEKSDFFLLSRGGGGGSCISKEARPVGVDRRGKPAASWRSWLTPVGRRSHKDRPKNKNQGSRISQEERLSFSSGLHSPPPSSSWLPLCAGLYWPNWWNCSQETITSIPRAPLGFSKPSRNLTRNFCISEVYDSLFVAWNIFFKMLLK